MLVVCGTIGDEPMLWFSNSCQGLFQISVNLPHDPYQIQVTVSVSPLGVDAN